jgi:acyl-CoA thioester hydrolase
MTDKENAATGTEFLWPIRVYYEDTDAGGVVYHSNYLKFLERARSEWLRALGYEQDRLMSDEKVVFAVRSVAIDYLRPARFNDELTVRTKVGKLGAASIEFGQRIERAGDQTISTAVVVVVCIDLQNFRPRALPDNIKEAIKRCIEHAG